MCLQHFYRAPQEGDLSPAKVYVDDMKGRMDIFFQGYHVNDHGDCENNVGVYFDDKRGRLSRITIYDFKNQSDSVMRLVQGLMMASIGIIRPPTKK